MKYMPPRQPCRHGLAGFVFFSVTSMILLSGCSIEKPQAPRWEAPVAVPLVDRTFTIAELIEDEDNLFSDSAGVVHFEVTRTFGRYQVGERLKINGIHRSISAELGDFHIESPDTAVVKFTLGEIFPPARNIPPGQTDVIPEFQFELDPKPSSQFKTFQYAKLASGWLEVTVRNNLPIPLGQSPDKPLTARIWAESPDGTPLEVVEYADVIAPYTTSTQVIDLSGHYLPNQFNVVVSGGSPGSNGTEIEVDPELGFSVAIFLRDLRVEEAVAKVPRQEVHRQSSFEIKDTLAVQSATIKRGRIRVVMQNQLPVGTEIEYSLPNFLKDGAPISGRLQLEPKMTSNEEMVLDGVELRTTEPGKPGEQELRFDWSFRTVDTGESMVHLYAADSVGVQIEAEEIVLSEITGEIGNVRVDLDPIVRTIDVPRHVDSLKFGAVNLDLKLVHTLQFPAHAQIDIRGEDRYGQEAKIRLQPELHPSVNGEERIDHLYVDETNPDVSQFLNILPNKIEATGFIQIGAPDWIASIEESDWAEASVTISAPITVAIPEQTAETEVDTLEIDVDDRQNFLDHLGEARLIAEVANHLPLSAEVSFKFGRTDSLVYDNPELVLGPVTVQSGKMAENGRVVQETVDNIEIILDADQLSFFKQDPICAGVEVYQPGTNGQTVSLYAKDYLKAKAYLKMSVLIGTSDSKNN